MGEMEVANDIAEMRVKEKLNRGNHANRTHTNVHIKAMWCEKVYKNRTQKPEKSHGNGMKWKNPLNKSRLRVMEINNEQRRQKKTGKGAEEKHKIEK